MPEGGGNGCQAVATILKIQSTFEICEKWNAPSVLVQCDYSRAVARLDLATVCTSCSYCGLRYEAVAALTR